MTVTGDATAILDRLAHDVGKYIARTARNIPPDRDLIEPWHAMLVADLYATSGQQRASATFEAALLTLPRPWREHPLAERARVALLEIDHLEAEVRSGERMAVRRAMSLALDIEAALRGLREACR